ncbi:hypothetical protein [Halobaculum lipolyticum]|uniref:Secreted protein n=1 Tax=Halobaculum lipolyticum TaxID=3032001 RepID=A0ABD5WDC2_9EURY|nr:hypothetical protein [Halobaculum sp. DT31]
MPPSHPPAPALALLALVVLVALGGCLGPTRGGEVVASPVERAPDDAVDRVAVDDGRIGTAVDRACSGNEASTVEFSGNERGAVRSAYDDLRSDDGRPTVRCGDGEGAVRVELALYT